jgi:hypothetical protein
LKFLSQALALEDLGSLQFGGTIAKPDLGDKGFSPKLHFLPSPHCCRLQQWWRFGMK